MNDVQHILILDDQIFTEPGLVRLTTELHKQGYILSTACNSAAALQILATKAVDLIILDWTLIEDGNIVHGIKIAQSLREAGSQVGIIGISQEPLTSHNIVEYLRYVDDYVSKPRLPGHQ